MRKRSISTPGRFVVEAIESRLLLSGKTIYVDVNAPTGGTTDGTSWATAYLDLSKAMTASVSGDQIRIADGTYVSPWPASSFRMQSGVSLFGGYAGASDPAAPRNIAAYPTILSGNAGKGYVVTASGVDPATALDGITITRGWQGLWLEGSSITVRSCAFVGNAGGGAIYNYRSSPTLINCTFVGNTAVRGGAMYNIGPYATPVLINCTFVGNSASEGGALYNVEPSIPALTNCIIYGNKAAIAPQISGKNMLGMFCLVEGGIGGTGDIDTDPLFVRNPRPGADNQWGTADDDYGDLHLRACSPAVDAGKNATLPLSITTDADGRSRFVDVPTTPDTGVGVAPIVDIGAYEASPALSAGSGGPYAVLEGGTVTLKGRGASDIAGAMQLEWDLDGDGAFDDATGESAVFDAAGLGAGIVSIGFRATDAAGRSVITSAAVPVLPRVVYVDPEAPGVGDGTDWANAYTNLATAMSCWLPGQTYRVANGTYKPATVSDRWASMQLRSGIALYGGYAGYGAIDPDARDFSSCQSILSGDIGTVGIDTDNSYHAIVSIDSDTSAVLDGFTLTGAKSDGGWRTGSGMLISGGSPTLRNCTFTGNSADYGGGVYIVSASPTFTDCSFTGNTPQTYGGGIYSTLSNLTLTRCNFTANSRAGLYMLEGTAVLTDCAFNKNSGGGVSAGVTSSVTLTRCAFTANVGSAVYGDTCTVTLSNCIFHDNRSDYGAAIYSRSATFTVTSSEFVGNYATFEGGGVYGSNISISGCTFAQNSADIRGGAISASGGVKVTDSTFIGNICTNGSALSTNASTIELTRCIFKGNRWWAIENMFSVTITGCTFEGNDGGINNYNSSAPTVKDCTFIRNSLLGAMRNYFSNPKIFNCSFLGNSSTYEGAALDDFSASPTVVNCLFVGNSSERDGGAVSSSNNSFPVFTNCTFIDNSAVRYGGAIYGNSTTNVPTLTNCIVYGNSATAKAQIHNSFGGIPIVTYTDVQGGFTGVGNINADPLFVRSPSAGSDGRWGTTDDDYGDQRLRVGSPCIDAGNDASVPNGTTTDLAGNPRSVDVAGIRDPGAAVDMGAYERTPPFADAAFIVDAIRPTITVKFSSEILASSLTATDLTLTNLTTGQVIDCAGATFSYSTATRTATWVFNTLLLDGNYRGCMTTASVTDAVSQRVLTADLAFDFFVLGGDANRDRVVDIRDLSILAGNWLGSGKIFGQGDFNYDGKVDPADLGILSSRWQQSLPLSPAVGSISAISAAPKRTATRVVSPIA